MTGLFARTLVPSAEVLESLVGEETVILHLGSDTYFGLDELGTQIWGMLKERLPLSVIRDRLAQEYNVDSSIIETDMIRYLNDLLAHQILVDG